MGIIGIADPLHHISPMYNILQKLPLDLIQLIKDRYAHSLK